MSLTLLVIEKYSNMIDEKIFARFPESSSASLSEISFSLIEQQKKSWQMLADGIAALENVQVRDVHCNGFDVKLQFNPKRIISSAAKTDTQSIKERKCFLSVENLPAEQKGIFYKETFLILCNPMPIFQQHFTISHKDHIPQTIEEYILSFLRLAKDFSPKFSVFYNGPKCGASAPDHMHFQASPTGKIPVEYDASDSLRREFRKKIASVSICTLNNFGRAVIILESTIEQEMELVFLRTMSAMRKVMNTNEEPLVNVLGSYESGMWRIIIFPRTKHRPDAYFKEGDEKILVSPASVDIGGLVITPLEKDFHSLNALAIENIFHEVTISDDMLNFIIEKI